MIVGGGFAGSAAARTLAGQAVEVTLVDQHNFHTFQPLLYQVATAGLSPLTSPTGAHHRPPRPQHRLPPRPAGRSTWRAARWPSPTGRRCPTTTWWWRAAPPPGTSASPAPPRTPTPHTLSDAAGCATTCSTTLEAADTQPQDYDDGAPTFVVVGGGATGVETAALVELLDVLGAQGPVRIDPRRTRVVLLDAGDPPARHVPREGARYAEDMLRTRGRGAPAQRGRGGDAAGMRLEGVSGCRPRP